MARSNNPSNINSEGFTFTNVLVRDHRPPLPHLKKRQGKDNVTKQFFALTKLLDRYIKAGFATTYIETPDPHIRGKVYASGGARP